MFSSRPVRSAVVLAVRSVGMVRVITLVTGSMPSMGVFRATVAVSCTSVSTSGREMLP